MQIDLQTRGFSLTDSWVAFVNLLLSLTLGISERHLLRAPVRITGDVHYPRGGLDKRRQFYLARRGP